MRKFPNTYVEYLLRKAEWSLPRKRNRPWRLERYRRRIAKQNIAIKEKQYKFQQLTPDELVILHGDLDLINKTDETLSRLSALDRAVARMRPFKGAFRLYVNLDDVTSIDAASILYLCSRIDEANRFGAVLGTWPSSYAALKTLQDANFGAFVAGISQPDFRPGGRALLELLHGSASKLNRRAAEQIQAFLIDRNAGLATWEKDTLYAAAFESLENVSLHAYGNRNPKRRRYPTKPVSAARSARESWFVVGNHDEATSTSTVAILDLGVGIRKSVQENPKWLGRILELSLGIVSTSAIIKQATLGKRTETGDLHRGQGLSILRQFSVATSNRRLHVMSGDGMVTWSHEGCVERKIGNVRGTIVCLEVRREPPPGGADAREAPGAR